MRIQQFRGALLGLACGDAVGTTVEFRKRGTFQAVVDMVGGGPFHLKSGEWTDDTSMALCLGVSLTECQGFDAQDQMRRYQRWMQEGYLSSNGRCFDVGGTVAGALRRFASSGNPYSGTADPKTAGNGSLMRLAPVPMAFFASRQQAIDYSGESARTTHGARECIDASRLFGAMLHAALSGATKEAVLFEQILDPPLAGRIAEIASGKWRDKAENDIRGSGYVVESLEAALWCFHHTMNFEDAVLHATNLGDDADTTAAICGQVAGAFYGEDSIPPHWRSQLARYDEILALADKLFAMGMTHQSVGSPNLAIARQLAATGELGIRWHERLDSTPPRHPESIDLANRIDGMMLGLAIGDALGNPTEAMLPHRRAEQYGWISGYIGRRSNGEPVGLPSDDTQLSFWTLEHLLDHGRLDPAALGALFTQRQIFWSGKSTREFLRNLTGGTPWHRAGAESAGNGALMRIAPVLIPYLQAPNAEIWGDVILAAHLTHRDASSTAACIAFIDLLWRVLALDSPPPPHWWGETFIEVLRDIEGEKTYVSREGLPPKFKGKLSQMLEWHVLPALTEKVPVADFSARWYSGAFVLETVAMVMHILGMHGHDPQAAILMAVNHTKDNDTVAAIVGAAVGALHGLSSLPKGWVSGLSGRTMESNDGEVFRLLVRAHNRFGIEFHT
jgi:ADP-ribosyl-[dinitrogen reductase] hydrolase